MKRQGIKSFNVYDVFANIIPGVVLLVGASFPFNVQRVLGKPITAATSITLVIIISFITGQFLQTIGGWADGDHGFPQLMRSIVNEKRNPQFEITEFDEYFVVLCDDTFELTEGFDDYTRLFKMLLAYLEYSGRSRALRMQALYLLSRGIWVSAWLLSFWFFAVYVSIDYNYLSETSLRLVNLKMKDIPSKSELTIAFLLATVLGTIFGRIRQEVEEDWVKYVITEFYLDRVTSQTSGPNRQNI